MRVLLFAGKVGSLGRYYKNLSPLGLRIAPETFVYGLTGCRYELIAADLGKPRGLTRLAWRLHIALLALLAFGLKGAVHGAFRRRVRRPAERVADRLLRPTEAAASAGLSPS